MIWVGGWWLLLIPLSFNKWPRAPSLLLHVQRHPSLKISDAQLGIAFRHKMSSAIGPLDIFHSDSDTERSPAAPFLDYWGPISARSPDATLLAGTRLTATATPATGGEHLVFYYIFDACRDSQAKLKARPRVDITIESGLFQWGFTLCTRRRHLEYPLPQPK